MTRCDYPNGRKEAESDAKNGLNKPTTVSVLEALRHRHRFKQSRCLADRLLIF
jgi:hypothetical protein